MANEEAKKTSTCNDTLQPFVEKICRKLFYFFPHQQQTFMLLVNIMEINQYLVLHLHLPSLCLLHFFGCIGLQCHAIFCIPEKAETSGNKFRKFMFLYITISDIFCNRMPQEISQSQDLAKISIQNHKILS